MYNITKLFIVISVFFSVHLFSQNLLTNGNFSGAVNTGYQLGTGYTLVPNTVTNTSPGQMIIATSTGSLNNNFLNFTDHTGGGNMLVVDGGNAQQTFWSAGTGAAGVCGLTVGNAYSFSYWIRTVSNNISNTQLNLRPQIGVTFGGVSNFALVSGNEYATVSSASTWQQVTYAFIASSNCVTIDLRDINTNGGGNDFAIDDLEVFLIPCFPQTLVITNPQSVCSPNTVDITVPAITNGSVIPGGTITYWQDVLASIPLTNPNAISTSGTYYVKSAVGTCQDIKPVVVTIVNSIIPSFTQVPAICTGGNFTLPITSTNGITGVWSPAINNSTTTTYTFTPNTTTINELIVNGNFSSGNTGFTSDYTFVYYNNNAKEYGIRNTAQSWYFAFDACTGNGGANNFLIANGSGTNTDAVWRSQTINVMPGQQYEFSYFAQSVVGASPARLEVLINGVSLGINTLPLTTCNWKKTSYVWNSGTSTTATISIINRNVDAFGNDFGIDDISFKSLSAGCVLPTTMTVSVISSPQVTSLTSNSPICANEDAIFTLVGTANATVSYTINAGATQTVVLDATGNGTVTITAATADQTILLSDITLGSCSTTLTNTETITVSPAAQLTSLTSNSPICANEDAIFTLVGTANATVSYTINAGATQTILLDNSGNAEILVPMAMVDQTIILSDIAFATCSTPLTDTATVTVNSAVTPTFNAVPPICEGEVLAPLPTTSLEGITGTWSPALDNTTTTLYTFEPDAGQCASNQRLEIVVNIPIYPDFEELIPICEGEIAPVLQNTSLNGITGTWNPPIVDNITSGFYVFTPDAGQCASIGELYMQVNQPTLTNVTCEVGEPFSGNRTITVYASLDGYYEYQLDGGTPQYENVFQNVEPGIHTVTVSDVNGCSASITKQVVIIDYPKFFTPNGDGYNDYWNIIGLDQPDAKIYIFDRYGKLLKQISTETQGWDGTFNGEQLPSTDYWFTIDYVNVANNNKDQFKAHFTLKR